MTQTAKHKPEIFVKRSRPVECEQCGEAATKKYTYLLEGNARANPASSAYGEDDCSWCSDHEEFGCDSCKVPQVDGYSLCSIFTKNNRFSHMFVTTKYEPIPKLLEALKAVVADYAADTPDTNGCEEPSIELARAVIAEAEGGK